MHPVARIFQILLIAGGLAMLTYALAEVGKGHHNFANIRFECTTVNTGTNERPKPKETCEANNASIYDKAHDEALVPALGGLGLMVGAVAVSIGSVRRHGGGSAGPLAAAPQQHGPQFPTQPGPPPPHNQ